MAAAGIYIRSIICSVNGVESSFVFAFEHAAVNDSASQSQFSASPIFSSQVLGSKLEAGLISHSGIFQSQIARLGARDDTIDEASGRSVAWHDSDFSVTEDAKAP